MTVVSCPAMSHPLLASATRLAPAETALLERKIHNLLATCRAHGATHLVLSALGCGAFRNPPDHVAALFRAALVDSGVFARSFKQIVFAIFDDHNAGKAHNREGNFLPFARCFSSPGPYGPPQEPAPEQEPDSMGNVDLVHHANARGL